MRRAVAAAASVLGIIFAVTPKSASAGILAEWTCDSDTTGPNAGQCMSVSADDTGNNVIKYSSTGDIPVEPVFVTPPNEQLNYEDAFTFEFNQQDAPPFNGIEDTSNGDDIEGEIVNGVINATKIADDDIQLTWDSIYPGNSGLYSIPADWQTAAKSTQIEGDVTLNYDPMNNNYISSVDVTLYTVPEPGSMVVYGSGLLGLLLATKRRRARFRNGSPPKPGRAAGRSGVTG